MNDALTTTRASDINRMAAKTLRPSKLNRYVYVHHLARTAILADYKVGLLRTRITLADYNGLTTHRIPNNSIVVG